VDCRVNLSPSGSPDEFIVVVGLESRGTRRERAVEVTGSGGESEAKVSAAIDELGAEFDAEEGTWRDRPPML
jgi:hypothetical protein